MTSDAPRQVPCPRCGTPARFDASNRWRPFCSDRCRAFDLGAWASESYRMPTRPSEDDDSPELPPDAPARG